VLQEGCGIVVEPGEAAELADQLLTLSSDTDEVTAMGRRGRALYEHRFGLERSLELYERLLEGKSP
jgi:glycosyltransferase involved in cell wall biosynthesis